MGAGSYFFGRLARTVATPAVDCIHQPAPETSATVAIHAGQAGLCSIFIASSTGKSGRLLCVTFWPTLASTDTQQDRAYGARSRLARRHCPPASPARQTGRLTVKHQAVAVKHGHKPRLRQKPRRVVCPAHRPAPAGFPLRDNFASRQRPDLNDRTIPPAHASKIDPRPAPVQGRLSRRKGCHRVEPCPHRSRVSKDSKPPFPQRAGMGRGEPRGLGFNAFRYRGPIKARYSTSPASKKPVVARQRRPETQGLSPPREPRTRLGLPRNRTRRILRACLNMPRFTLAIHPDHRTG